MTSSLTPASGTALAEPSHAAPGIPLAPPPPGGDPAREYLLFVLGVIRRHRLFLAVFVLLIAALATLVVSQITPLYRAETQLVLEAPQSRTLPSGIQALLGGGLDASSSETEAAVLTSLDLADRVIDKLDLTQASFFIRSRPTASPVTRAWDAALNHLRAWLPEDVFTALHSGPSAAMPPTEIRNRVYDNYFRNLTVRAEERSRVIDIRFVADNPLLTAAVCNTLADIYIQDQIERLRQNVARENEWLGKRVDDARARVEDAQRRLEEFRNKTGVFDIGGSTALQRQITEYGQQLTAAQIRRTDLESKARQLQALARTGGDVTDSAAGLDSTNLQHLRDQEASAAARVADLSTQFRPDHPKLQQAQAELNDIRAKIAAAGRQIVSAAVNQARQAKDQEEALSARLADLSKQLQQQASVESDLRLLEVDAKTSTELYQTLLNSMRETMAIAGRVPAAPVRIISRATPADHPFFPNKTLLVAAAAAVAMLIGVLLSFVLEFLDVGFRNRQQIEAVTGLETVASIPRLPTLVRARRLSDMRRILRSNPIFAEAIRYVRVGLSLSPDPNRPIRTILVTSALPDEGKTFTSRALAVTFAMGGKRVITIDCDLRQKPRRWSRRTDNEARPGLADFLEGKADAGAIIGTDPTTGLHHIDCGNTSDLIDAPILLDSERMRQLMRSLASMYDMVILDTPPVKLFPDTLVLQQQIDKVLFLVRWAKTRREIAIDALKVVIQAGRFDPVVGLTQVDLSQLHRYDYAAQLPKGYGEEYLARREAG